MKKIVLLFLLFPVLAFGAASVRFQDSNAPLVHASNSTAFASTFSLVVDDSGSSTDDSTPAEAYLPFASAAGTQTALRNFSTIADTSLIPHATAGAVRAYVKVTISDAGDHWLYAAVKDTSGDYKIVSNAIQAFNGTTTGVDVYASFDLNDFCNNVSNPTVDCTTYTAQNTEDFVIVKFFLTGDSGTLSPNDNEPADNDDGVFLKLSMSDNINASKSIVHNTLVKGDGRLTSFYTGSTINDFYRIQACVKEATYTGNAGPRIACTSSSELKDLATVDVVGSGAVKGLTNNTNYFVSVFFENKYQLATNTSNVLSETPEDIEALLEKQACFILTAGFQEEHPVTDYFQDFRDTVLKKFWLGREFISFYYAQAPKAAPTILRTPWLAASIRVVATAAYYAMKFWWISLFTFLVLLSGYIWSYFRSRRESLA